MAVQQAIATADTTIASATYALLDSMTITPGAGDYVLSFTSSCGCSSEADIFFQVYVNGVAVAHTERVFRHEASIIGTDVAEIAQIYAYLPSVGAGEAVEIRWQRTSAGTATCHERTLTLQEVNSSDLLQATATGDTSTSSTTDVLIPSMSLSAASGDGSYIAYFSTSIFGDSGATIFISLYVNGVQVAHTQRRQFQESSIIDTEFMLGIVSGLTLTDGDVVDVRWRTSATDQITAHERTLVLQKISGYDMAVAAGSTTTTNGAYTVLGGMTLTPGAGDYLAFFTSSFENDTSGSNQQMLHTIFDNGVQITHTERNATSESSIPDTPVPAATHGYVAGLGDAEAVDIRWQDGGAGTTTAWERTLVMISAEQVASSSSSSSSLSSSSSSSSLSSSSSSSSLSSSSSSSVSSSSTSSSSASEATVTWGHDTGIEEDVARDFSGNWQLDNVTVSGSGDSETLTFACPSAIAISEEWLLGAMGAARIDLNKYDGLVSGPQLSIEYRTSTTKIGLASQLWNVYTGLSFISQGWVQIRLYTGLDVHPAGGSEGSLGSPVTHSASLDITLPPSGTNRILGLAVMWEDANTGSYVQSLQLSGSGITPIDASIHQIQVVEAETRPK